MTELFISKIVKPQLLAGLINVKIIRYYYKYYPFFFESYFNVLLLLNHSFIIVVLFVVSFIFYEYKINKCIIYNDTLL